MNLHKGIIEKYKRMPQTIRASIWFLVCSFVQKAVSVISTPIFTRLMTTSEYGKYGVFNSWLNIVTIFVSLRMYYSTYTQGLVKFEEDRQRFISSTQGVLISLVAGWTLVYISFQSFWNKLFNLTTVQMLAMLVMIWTTGVINFWAAEKRVEFRYRALVIVTVIVSVLQPVLCYIFVVNAEDKVTARILGIMLVDLIAYFGLFIVQMKRGKCFFSKQYWKRAILLNLPLIPHYLSQTILNSADRIMIDSMVGNSQAGIYSLANSLSQLMTLFNTALLQTLNPWVFKKLKCGKTEGIASISYITMISIGCLNLCLLLFAPEIIAIFAPVEYSEAIWVVPPIAISVYFVYSYGVFAEFEFYFEKTKQIMLISVIGAGLNVLLNYIFIPIYGYFAAGYTTLVCYIIYAFGHYYVMRGICKKEYSKQIYDSKKVIGMSVVFIALAGIILLSYHSTIIRYSFIIAAFVLIVIKRKVILNRIQDMVSLRKESKKQIVSE